MRVLNRKLFSRIKKEYSGYASARRNLIEVSNRALSKSKQAIFALHRDDKKEAARLLGEVKSMFIGLDKVLNKTDGLRFEGAYRAALEEYAEASLFFEFLDSGSIDKGASAVKFDADIYLAGLSDLTGELARKCVQRAIQGRTLEVAQLAEAVREIIGELIEFNLTGYLRTKYDQAKQNLRRVEEVLYDIKMRRG